MAINRAEKENVISVRFIYDEAFFLREALRRLKATPGARFVKLLPHALPLRYDPSAEDSREIAAGRLLLLSGCPDTPSIPSLEIRRSPSAAHEFRRNCLVMNDLAATICAR